MNMNLKMGDVRVNMKTQMKKMMTGVVLTLILHSVYSK